MHVDIIEAFLLDNDMLLFQLWNVIINSSTCPKPKRSKKTLSSSVSAKQETGVTAFTNYYFMTNKNKKVIFITVLEPNHRMIIIDYYRVLDNFLYQKQSNKNFRTLLHWSGGFFLKRWCSLVELVLQSIAKNTVKLKLYDNFKIDQYYYLVILLFYFSFQFQFKRKRNCGSQSSLERNYRVSTNFWTPIYRQHYFSFRSTTLVNRTEKGSCGSQATCRQKHVFPFWYFPIAKRISCQPYYR